VNTLRFLIAALALGIVAGSVLAPADVMSYLLAGPPAVLILFLAFGAIAADALPLQRVPLALMLIVDPWRPLPVVVLAAAILTLQLVAWWRARRASSPARI
jgi:hypothetical protein